MTIINNMLYFHPVSWLAGALRAGVHIKFQAASGSVQRHTLRSSCSACLLIVAGVQRRSSSSCGQVRDYNRALL